MRERKKHTRLPVRVPSYIPPAAAPVIHHVIRKLIHPLHLWVPRLVIDVKVPEQRHPAVCLHQAPARVRLQALRDNRVLHRDILCRPADRERLIPAPGHGEMVEDHVFAFCNGDSVLS